MTTTTRPLTGVYVAGRAGAGKSTCARYLASRLAPDGVRIYTMSTVLEVIAEERHVWLGELRGRRRKLQRIARLARDEYGPDYVARIVLDAFEDHRRRGAVAAVADGVRLPEEAALFRRHGWFGLLVDAPDDVRRERLRRRDGDDAVADAEEWWDDDTETAVTAVPVDAVVDNAASLSDLFERLDRTLELWRIGTALSGPVSVDTQEGIP